ncbi:glycerol-3-phosphate 1-O-acyltransferase PlsY [Paracoccaceae bacterium]|jgi:glycerol-3-phosphate acyltransferase PlsY|nr:glycerol-3-phosphate 1-O-acyltransferase PlsY [Paracoccaceae bacterium]MDB4229968.1 glycerol-3-phosphate 1-O-acyltransferase PlsY [Paracoccaceae bacterium]MDC1254572.1 glycerol-3-phosphate 1-O-acyltransferase PlsY [Paracoccaceae bacterium]|tara:strand:- start:948 stop:1538 length:591 start_codon:yes stop_codon:yes gene_type:complete
MEASILTFSVISFSYLLGSIPFGILVSKVFGLGNLRDIGSGNIGATNVLRTGNKLAALITLILDGLKGVLVVVVARFISEDAAITASIFVIIGHIYPVWLRFSGGKGVATFIGAILALSFVTGLLVCFIWIIIALIFRYSSLSAIVSSASAPIGVFLFYDNEALVVTLFMTVLIWYRHKDNIRRLIDGSEAKIGKI